MDGQIRFYLNTGVDDDGNTVAQVMERPRPFAAGACVGEFTHEWRACKRIDELKQEAYQRGERVVYNRGEDASTWA